jgi:hypothetical protein
MITFGICVGSDYIDFDKENLRKIIASINETAGYNPYEIIFMGNRQYCRYSYGQVSCHAIDCFTKDAWITKKKNEVTNLALFDTIVYSHDYLIYDENFYDVIVNSDFDIAVPRILNKDGSRYRDKISWGDPKYPPVWIQRECWCPPEGLYHPGSPRLEPYDREIPREYWFVNGTFWIAKKSFMQKYRLDESLCWGDGEDVEFSLRFRKDTSTKLEYLIDTYVQSLIQKDLIYKYAEF